jgi:hypothetical protein
MFASEAEYKRHSTGHVQASFLGLGKGLSCQNPLRTESLVLARACVREIPFTVAAGRQPPGRGKFHGRRPELVAQPLPLLS